MSGNNATRVDLDAVQAAAQAADNPSAEIPRTVLAMVVELRAAREVVQAVADWWIAEDVIAAEAAIAAALQAYDEAVTA